MCVSACVCVCVCVRVCDSVCVREGVFRVCEGVCKKGSGEQGGKCKIIPHSKTSSHLTRIRSQHQYSLIA